MSSTDNLEVGKICAGAETGDVTKEESDQRKEDEKINNTGL